MLHGELEDRPKACNPWLTTGFVLRAVKIPIRVMKSTKVKPGHILSLRQHNKSGMQRWFTVGGMGGGGGRGRGFRISKFRISKFFGFLNFEFQNFEFQNFSNFKIFRISKFFEFQNFSNFKIFQISKFFKFQNFSNFNFFRISRSTISSTLYSVHHMNVLWLPIGFRNFGFQNFEFQNFSNFKVFPISKFFKLNFFSPFFTFFTATPLLQ